MTPTVKAVVTMRALRIGSVAGAPYAARRYASRPTHSEIAEPSGKRWIPLSRPIPTANGV